MARLARPTTGVRPATRPPRLPDRGSHLRYQLKLLLLHVLRGQVSARQGRGKPALRRDAEPLKPGVLGRLGEPMTSEWCTCGIARPPRHLRLVTSTGL